MEYKPWNLDETPWNLIEKDVDCSIENNDIHGLVIDDLLYDRLRPSQKPIKGWDSVCPYLRKVPTNSIQRWICSSIEILFLGELCILGHSVFNDH